MLSEMYGAGFLQKYGEKPGPLWRQVVGELTDEQIDAGMSLLMAAGGAFAPSLPEFKAACLKSEESEIEQAEIELLAFQMIPSFDRQTMSRRDLEFLAKRNLDRARSLLMGEASPNGTETNVMERLGHQPHMATHSSQLATCGG